MEQTLTFNSRKVQVTTNMGRILLAGLVKKTTTHLPNKTSTRDFRFQNLEWTNCCDFTSFHQLTSIWPIGELVNRCATDKRWCCNTLSLIIVLTWLSRNLGPPFIISHSFRTFFTFLSCVALYATISWWGCERPRASFRRACLKLLAIYLPVSWPQSQELRQIGAWNLETRRFFWKSQNSQVLAAIFKPLRALP